MLERLHRPVVCIVGPTATGKSALGVQLAKAIGGEVLSADSMQVYRGMDIGTAKLTPEEMDGVPHHLIDMVDPDEPFSVAAWNQAAGDVIDRLHAIGKIPVVVGGTGLYIRAITEDLDFAGRPGSPDIREKWAAFANQHGAVALHEALAVRDAASASRLHPNDVRRVIRALELWELTDEPMSNGYEWRIGGGRYDTVQLGLYVPRAALYDRVNRRVDRMTELGLWDEVEGLIRRGYHTSLTSMQAIGYKEMAAAIHGEISYAEAIDMIKRATRRFVKRQLSWFMRDPRIIWFPLCANGHTLPPVTEVLKTIVRVRKDFLFTGRITCDENTDGVEDNSS